MFWEFSRWWESMRKRRSSTDQFCFRTACLLISYTTHTCVWTRLCSVMSIYLDFCYIPTISAISLDWLECLRVSGCDAIVTDHSDFVLHFAEKPDERRRMREPRRIQNFTWRRLPSRGNCRSWTWECSWIYRPDWITTSGWPRTLSHFLTILISSMARYPSSAPWRVVPIWPVLA